MPPKKNMNMIKIMVPFLKHNVVSRGYFEEYLFQTAGNCIVYYLVTIFHTHIIK